MEFPSVGQKCNWEGCAQLDFLPVQCKYCENWFCKDHMAPLAHTCKSVPDNVKTDEEIANREKWHFKCTFQGCNAKEMVEMKCGGCGNHFCLQHRLLEQHNCPKLQVEPDADAEARKSAVETSLDQQKKIKDQIIQRLKEAEEQGGAKGAMAKRLALMKLKGRSEGDKAIPQTERIFFSVSVGIHDDPPKIYDMFVSKTWSMGKIVDVIARRARVKNRNNQADAPKLHLFKEDLCISSPFDQTLNQLVAEGVFEDGDSISMKHVEL